jgi:hypothetical protein
VQKPHGECQKNVQPHHYHLAIGRFQSRHTIGIDSCIESPEGESTENNYSGFHRPTKRLGEENTENNHSEFHHPIWHLMLQQTDHG